MTYVDATVIQNLLLFGIMITQTYFYITTFKEYVGTLVTCVQWLNNLTVIAYGSRSL
jgi:hypothetical protein